MKECDDMGIYAELNVVISWARSGTLSQVRLSHGCATAGVVAPRRQLQGQWLLSWRGASHASMTSVTSKHSYDMNTNNDDDDKAGDEPQLSIERGIDIAGQLTST